jgi:hypothetical protein
MDAGSTREMRIVVENVSDLYGVEFEITFDSALLEVVDVKPHRPGVQISPGDFLSPDWTLKNAVDNESGTIAYALSQQNPSKPVSGDGTLAVITWRGKSSGTSAVSFSYALLAGPAGAEIGTTTEDAQIIVGSPAAAPPDTSDLTESPTPSPARPEPTSTPIPPTSTSPSSTSSDPPVTDPPTPTVVAPSATPTETANEPLKPASTSTDSKTPAPTTEPKTVDTIPAATSTPVSDPGETPESAASPAQPTSVAATQPESTQPEQSLDTPLPTPSPETVSSQDSSSILFYVSLVSMAAGLGALAFGFLLWRRGQ